MCVKRHRLNTRVPRFAPLDVFLTERCAFLQNTTVRCGAVNRGLRKSRFGTVTVLCGCFQNDTVRFTVISEIVMRCGVTVTKTALCRALFFYRSIGHIRGASRQVRGGLSRPCPALDASVCFIRSPTPSREPSSARPYVSLHPPLSSCAGDQRQTCHRDN